MGETLKEVFDYYAKASILTAGFLTGYWVPHFRWFRFAGKWKRWLSPLLYVLPVVFLLWATTGTHLGSEYHPTPLQRNEEGLWWFLMLAVPSLLGSYIRLKKDRVF